VYSTKTGLEQAHIGPPAASAAGQLALWTAANLAGMVTSLLVTREPFFRKLMNRVGGHRRRRVIRVKRPAREQSLPMLAQALLGSNRRTIVAVFGPPRAACVSGPCAAGASPDFWHADTWYYPLPRAGALAMALAFDEDHASTVEFFQPPGSPA